VHTTPNRGFPAETQGRDADDPVANSLPPVVSAGSAIMLLFLALAASAVAAQHAVGFSVPMWALRSEKDSQARFQDGFSRCV